MKFTPDNLYHVYNQGNNRQTIFYSSEDYFTFLRTVRRCLLPYSEIIAYCLMPNHFHFLLFADERCSILKQQGSLLLDPITNSLRKLLSGYARIYNDRYRGSGSVFRQKTKAKCLSDIIVCPDQMLSPQDYYFNCFHYIHQNPFRRGLVKRMEDWEYSSFKDYAGLRNGTLCNKALGQKFCDYDANDFLKTSYQLIPDHIIQGLF